MSSGLLEQAENGVAGIQNLQYPMPLNIFDTNNCTFWNFCSFSYLPDFDAQTVDATDCIENQHYYRFKNMLEKMPMAVVIKSEWKTSYSLYVTSNHCAPK